MHHDLHHAFSHLHNILDISWFLKHYSHLFVSFFSALRRVRCDVCV